MYKSYKHQSGAVLIVSLIMLLLLTLIGAAGMQTTMLEEKMAGNMRDANLAFQAAETALRAGESTAAAATINISCPGVDNPVGYYLPLDVNCDGTKEPTPVWENAAVWKDDDTKSIKYNTDGNTATIDLTNLSANPRYIIEELPIINSKSPTTNPGGSLEFGTISSTSSSWYRITARGTGGSGNAVVILQSIYSR